MPIKIPNKLPAKEILTKERIFVMNEDRAMHQDIRELKIAILNLMPIKHITETQLLRLLGNTPLQIEVTFLHPATHHSKNTSTEHLTAFYKKFDEIKMQKFDGMIITGAPIEHLDFEDVNYWDELKSIMEWTKTNVTSTMHICWGAQAGLYYHYGIPKYQLNEKKFGVFKHKRANRNYELLRGFDDEFYVPHSRHTEIKKEDVEKVEDLCLLAESEEAGVHMLVSRDKKHVFVTGHCEYDSDTLKNEYVRDKNKGLDIETPKHYFRDDNPELEPKVKWKGHANLLFSNWLNYYVYQITPYKLEG